MNATDSNLLIIALEFPPLNSGGSFRPFYFAKYLPEFAVNSVILTINVSNHPKASNKLLLKELPKETKIIRIDANEKLFKNKYNKLVNKIIHYFKTDDLWARYIKHSMKRSFKSIIKENNINIALITIPPFSSPRLFIPLLQRLNIPIILDMRDHYSLWCPAPYATFFHFVRVHFVEKYYLSSANKILVVSDQMKKDLLTIHQKIPKDKIHVIPNGITNPINDTAIWTKSILEYNRKFIIGYSGNFYYNPEDQKEIMKSIRERKGLKKLYYLNRVEDWKYRSPYFFFKTLQKLFEHAPELKEKIEFQFAGEEPTWLLDQLSEFGLKENYKYVGYLNSLDIKKFHENCDAYLITSVKVIKGRDYCIASKTFSYLEGGKPILGFVTEGEQQDMLKSTGLGVIFDADETEVNVLKLYNFLMQPQKFEYNLATNDKYLRRNHANTLAGIISKILDN